MIRFVKETDAEQLADLMNHVELSGFMLVDPNERNVSAQGIKALIQRADNEVLVSENERLDGYVIIQKNKLNRIRHRASLVMGVHEAARGKGVGTALLTTVERWAEEQHISRLELGVMATNVSALHVYEKCGFVIEGIRRNALFVYGAYCDELYMGKTIESFRFCK